MLGRRNGGSGVIIRDWEINPAGLLCGQGTNLNFLAKAGEVAYRSTEDGYRRSLGHFDDTSVCCARIQNRNDAAKMNRSCVSAGTKPEILRQIFVKMGHLGLHNELPASQLAMTAFTAVWGCFAQNDLFKDAFKTLGKALRPTSN